MKITLPPSPDALSKEAAAIWTRIVTGWQLDDSGLLILASALESFDLMRKAQAILVREGIQVKDRFDQIKQHPAVTTERDARAAYLRALKALHLDFSSKER